MQNSNGDKVELFEVARALLAEDIAERVPQPLDPLEIAAVIESTGINDAVAREDYGCEDVFDLARRVFPAVFEANVSRASISHRPEDPRREVGNAEEAAILETAGRGLLALAPLALLIVAIEGLGRAGWTTSSVLALSLGISAAMLVTSGPILAIGRRTSIYLGFGYRSSARQFLVRSSVAMMVVSAVAALVVLAGSTILGVFTLRERLTFSGALAAFAVLWLLTSSLALARRTLAATISMAAGLAIGIAVGIAARAALGLAAGYGATTLLLLVAWGRAYTTDVSRRIPLPALALLVLEAGPYVAYGSAFALFLLEPHVLGWAGHASAGRGHAITTLELSLTLSLPPVLLASGIHEQIMRSFWAFTKARQASTDASGFRQSIQLFHRSQLASYAAALALLSLVMAAIVEIIVLSGGLRSLSQMVFLCGIGAFFVLGLGQFHCLFMLSLSRPKEALWGVLAGMGTVALAGVPLSEIDFKLAAAAFVVGGGIFAVASGFACRRVLDNADYLYATTL